jgi:CRISPR-associated protein Cmr1
MIRHPFSFDIITACLCSGADQNHAEIRAPSIRGQLRWWFRVLGGFASLATTMTIRQQEALIFGTTAGEEGSAGCLQVRVLPHNLIYTVKDGQQLLHRNFSDSAYLTFPIQTREKDGVKQGYAGRGMITSGSFTVALLWRGPGDLSEDLRALMAVFGHLGSLGFRGRRAMGAFAPGDASMGLSSALQHFSEHATALRIFQVGTSCRDAAGCISALGRWLRSWRQHGRTIDINKPGWVPNKGFTFAKRDHDLGYFIPSVRGQAAFRPALGLPIVQKITGSTNNWEWSWNSAKRRDEGRFASPVLLRPHRAKDGSFHALVIFVESRKWPSEINPGGIPSPKSAVLNGSNVPVSLDLYEAMQKDTELKAYP